MSPPPAPNPIRDSLIARADALREADALAEARDLYRLVLDRHPGHGPALAGLGRILLRLGQPAAAIESLGAAAASDPTRLDWPADLAVALAGAHRPAEALRIAESLPATPGALGFRADRLEELGRRDQAIALLDEALSRHPDEPELHRRRGVLLRRAGRAAQAIANWRALVALRPEDAGAWSSLGASLGESGLDEEAEKALRRAVALAADEPDWTYNLAHFLIERDRLDDALPLLEAAIARAPGRAHYHTNLGVCRLGLGDIDGAIAAHRQALALDPDEPEARYDLAWALLLAGAWEEGWAAHEARWRMGRFTGRRAAGPAPTDWPMPLWDGQPLGPDRTLLLHAEQGFGDSLMMARLIIPALERADAQGIVACPPPLVGLLAHPLGLALGPAVRVVAQTEVPPAADAHLPLMSLPHRLGIDSRTIPGPGRWLRAEPAPRPPPSPPRVGLAWAGDPGNRMDRLRSCPATALRPLLDQAKDAGLDIAWTGLQLGPPAADLPDLPAALAPGGDFAATARIVAALDLVIGVDTAVIHLAGGLGVETWVMLAYVPDYRWMMDRPDSPWYPSVRLFRQTRRGDWRGVIAQVAAALTKRFG